MEWISVKDKKPEENQVVWAITKEHQGPAMFQFVYVVGIEESGWVWATVYDVPYYHKGKWIADSEWDDDYNIEMWMPLPEPPQKQ